MSATPATPVREVRTPVDWVRGVMSSNLAAGVRETPRGHITANCWLTDDGWCLRVTRFGEPDPWKGEFPVLSEVKLFHYPTRRRAEKEAQHYIAWYETGERPTRSVDVRPSATMSD